MEKKEFKMYESPAVEIVEMGTVTSLLSASDPQGPELPGGGDEIEW